MNKIPIQLPGDTFFRKSKYSMLLGDDFVKFRKITGKHKKRNQTKFYFINPLIIHQNFATFNLSLLYLQHILRMVLHHLLFWLNIT